MAEVRHLSQGRKTLHGALIRDVVETRRSSSIGSNPEPHYDVDVDISHHSVQLRRSTEHTAEALDKKVSAALQAKKKLVKGSRHSAAAALVSTKSRIEKVLIERPEASKFAMNIRSHWSLKETTDPVVPEEAAEAMEMPLKKVHSLFTEMALKDGAQAAHAPPRSERHLRKSQYKSFVLNKRGMPRSSQILRAGSTSSEVPPIGATTTVTSTTKVSVSFPALAPPPVEFEGFGSSTSVQIHRTLNQQARNSVLLGQPPNLKPNPQALQTVKDQVLLKGADIFSKPTNNSATLKAKRSSASATQLKTVLEPRKRRNSNLVDTRLVSQVRSDSELPPGAPQLKTLRRASMDSKGQMDAALTVHLALIQATAENRKNLSEKYLPSKLDARFPKCTDHGQNISCLPVSDLAAQALRPFDRWGIPEETPLGIDQLLHLIHSIRDHPTNEHLCLMYVYPLKHAQFNPYWFKIVQFQNLNLNQYLTISRNGVLVFTKGFARFQSLVKFEREILIFDKLRQIDFFTHFRAFKAFYIWRSNVRRRRRDQTVKVLEENWFMSYRPLRLLILQLVNMSRKIASMGFLSLHSGTVYTLKNFIGGQINRLTEIQLRFRAFEELVLEMAAFACKEVLVDAGFPPDDYEAEMDYYIKSLDVPLEQLHNFEQMRLEYPGEWLSYTLQMKKRRLCERLANFIHLLDYQMQHTYHQLLRNSMIHLIAEMNSRIKNIEPQFMVPTKHDVKYDALVSKFELLEGPIAIVQTSTPIFEVGCNWDELEMAYAPSLDEFKQGLRSVFNAWEDAVATYPNMLGNKAFDPFTQPVINGQMRPKTCGPGPSMRFLIEIDQDIKTVLEVIDSMLAHGFACSDEYTEKFEEIRLFCLQNESINVDTYRNLHDVKDFADALEKFHQQFNLVNNLESSHDMGVFRINNSILRANAIPTIQRCLGVLHEVIPKVGAEQSAALLKTVKEQLETLKTLPTNADEYVDYLLFLEALQEKIEDIEADLDNCAEIYDLVKTYEIPVDGSDLAAFQELQPLMSQLREGLDEQLSNWDQLVEQLLEHLKRDTEEMFKDMEAIRQEAFDPAVLSKDSNPEEMLEKMTALKDRLSKHLEKATKFNQYQKQLKLEVTDFQAVEELMKEVKLRHQLWDSITSWATLYKSWHETPFENLDAEEIAREIQKYLKNIAQLEKGLPPNELVPMLKSNVEEMKALLPLITNLHNPNLKARHWDELERIMKRKLTGEDVTLESLKESHFEQFAEEIQEMSSQASAEFSLEALLKKVEDSWKEVDFLVLPHKDSKNVFILGGTDDIQIQLDDSNLHMATIANSKHVGPIKHKVDEWVRLLDLFGKTLDEWLKCQMDWIYLESIFSAPDIQRQMPNEAKMFAQVDKSWREIMSRTKKMPAALRAATQPGLFELLQTNNELLGQIMKCLDDYLESKRAIFPRFYFLSNEELLEILAQTRNPLAVQPHLRKCFDAIQRLDFSGPPGSVALDILAMVSPEEERVPLTKGLKARGNVEEWLGRVEDAMFNSLKRIMRECLADYHVMEREDWIAKFPAQCILTISQLMWGQYVHEILDGFGGNKLDKMREFEKKNFKDLAKLAAKVRQQLPPLVRAVLCSLITIDVHARDIVTNLVKEGVTDSSSFEWLKQLRYYWEPEDETVVSKMANASYKYGYEYLGASPRLVITPLTDRCYLCLMGALQLDLGGAPAGPAGTGKTETTKDLAKSLAFMCVVFNCSDGLDYKMMGRFFAGLAQSGGWCCFDEFNRIEIEVLSVIAQQLITIRMAKVQRLNRFMFEGREIKLVRTCAAFITMNPGYAGRTELPDNLKALFRPISMMVPDYTLIAEVILYSEGFESSKVLANKMTQMYKLCSEQLSQQDHYDFGMRAVKSVLVMAGALKRANPDISEDIVLIRALRDSNLPKFLAHDAVLLHGIIQDLFPGIVIPEQDYGILQKEAIKVALDRGLQVPECFITKVIQFFDTLVVRHGLMLVGPSGGGKTCIYQVLKEALTALGSNKQLAAESDYWRSVDTYVLNPKAITSGELYGEFNPLTLEWRDGLMGVMFRTAVKPKMTHHQWIVCDGPVDAVWIENMNTVLDDNKMLCLANSERIKMTQWVRLMFEVQDLSQASPATVSRCGMVYVDSKAMGWLPYVKSWLQRTSFGRGDQLKPLILELCSRHIDNGLDFLSKNCSEMIPQVPLGKVVMLTSIVEALLKKAPSGPELEGGKFKQQALNVFVFAYIWGLGGNLDEKDHIKFETFTRQEFSNEKSWKIPKAGSLYSYFVNFENRQMEKWDAILPGFVYNSSTSFVDMFVPTVDTVRYGFLMELLLSADRPVLYTGHTGTGKSAVAKYVLQNIAAKYSYLPTYLNFSAQTSSKRTQEVVEGKLEKRKKGLLSAPFGKKVIMFIDDLNMPKLDKYGAQPALELLRQIIDFGGCYDRQKLFWKELQNVVLSAACAPPGGGRNVITARLLRHFCLLAIPTPETKVLQHIFKAVVRGFLEDFPEEVRFQADNIVTSAIAVYQYMSATFLPTPSKSHYVFNLRDLSKCIQGVLQAERYVTNTSKDLARLFCHESMRVFHDRLVDDQDRQAFITSLSNICTKNLKVKISEKEAQGLLFADFQKPHVDRENWKYEEVSNKDKLKQILSDFMDEYNIMLNQEVSLVFFMDAVEYITRISRILRLDRGNALLVGVGGVGKQSLTRLASYIAGYKCFQIELMRGYDYEAFHEDLRKLYDIAGAQNQKVVFLFTDTQIAYEEFLEDINNILNSGEVPNLLEPEEQERMLALIKSDARELGIEDPENREVLYDHFIRRIRTNLHIVLCMSPVGDNFRVRCRMFPSLVNCCTINWFSEWPTEALHSVANMYISKVTLGQNVGSSVMAEICVFVHESVASMASKFFQETRRKYYATPKSYLELIWLFVTMLNEHREKVSSDKARIQNGLTKLLETNALVKDMRVKLKDLEPILRQKSEAVENLMVTLSEDQANADVVRKYVQQEEAVAKEKAVETQAIAEDAEKDLATALPALEAAVKALDALDSKDIAEVRGYVKPPKAVSMVMESVCVLFNRQPDWATAKQILADANFMKKLENFDKERVSAEAERKLKVYIDNPGFNPDAVGKVSKACKSICIWVRAIDGYVKVFRLVEPKRNRYLAAKGELDQVMETLQAKQAQLNEVERKIRALQDQFDKSVHEKQDLEENMELTAARLRRAGRLTSALASEQIRWQESVKNFDQNMQNIIGDVFVGAACIAYFGAFTNFYRQILVKQWVQQCTQLKVPVTASFSLAQFADPFEVRVWNNAGLPRDSTSTENAVLATRSRQWPLMIDPQDQANRWVKQLETPNGLKIMKLTESNFMRTMENCIRLGKPCLLEDVGEQLDPSLEPVLLKKLFVQDGRQMIRLGDTNVDYDSNFKLYMTSKMANPHYLPEVCVKVTLINFTVTLEGLEDQLLSEVVGIEQPELETQRSTLVSSINADKNSLISLESKILKLLFTSQGSILDDEELVEALNNSKKTSLEIVKRLKEAEDTETRISAAREKYRSVAARGSVLYFTVAQLASLEPMYQFSLKYFVQVFIQCIAGVEKEEGELEERLKLLMKLTTLATYTNVSRGLFEKDKLVFSFLLCTDIYRSLNKIPAGEWDYFLRGAVGQVAAQVDNAKRPEGVKWISDLQWAEVGKLEKAFPSVFGGLKNSALNESVKLSVGAVDVVVFEGRNSAGGAAAGVAWNKKLTKFQKLMLIKAVAEDKLMSAILEYVRSELGQAFVESPPIDLVTIFKDLNKATPLTFILTVGSDPMASFYRLAKHYGFHERIFSISLGQGQGPVAENMISKATSSGDWVFLQNCHLAQSWMPSLERIVQDLQDNEDEVSDNFRLFMSSMPTNYFPVTVLQSSMKLTNEPPKGIRANVRQALGGVDRTVFETHILDTAWRKIIFGVCFFHAVIQERKKFGPLGWNIRYEFNDSDRECAFLNLGMFCKDGVVPWDALEYITSLITYGGRVTDYWDQRCLSTILKIYFSPQALQQGHKFSPSGRYFAPTHRKLGEYAAYVDGFPVIDDPEIFGMHENANITFRQNEMHTFLESMIVMQPRQVAGKVASHNDEIAYQLCTSLEARLPKRIQVDKMAAQLSTVDGSGRAMPLSIFLRQEVDRFNKLLDVIGTSLEQLAKGIKGLVSMSEALEGMHRAFLNNQVPENWSRAAYGSTKPLASWFSDLILRVKRIETWFYQTEPSSHWLSGFFFQQGFLTAVLQTYARRHNLPIDRLNFHFVVSKVTKEESAHREEAASLSRPRDGVLVHGLYLDAASWDFGRLVLGDPRPGEMNPPMPVIHFLPTEIAVPDKNVYTCPLYKTSQRAGVLSTTGHSTNFIVAIQLPSDKPEAHWILKGTALLSQLPL